MFRKIALLPNDSQPERGSALAELAVILPLLLVTTVGLVDFGRAAFEAIEVENAAHAGAAYGARSKGLAADTAGITAAAIADLGDEVDASKVAIKSERFCECDNGSSIDCDNDCAGVQPRIYVRVEVQKQFTTLLTYPGIPNSIDLDRQVQLRVR
jgi:Flp pilus assembly protein TadG